MVAEFQVALVNERTLAQNHQLLSTPIRPSRFPWPAPLRDAAPERSALNATERSALNATERSALNATDPAA